MAQLYPEDIGSITAARSFKHTYLVTITGTSPSAWTAYFCSAGRTIIDTVTDTQQYQPAIIVDPDLVGDSGGPLRTSFTLAVRGPTTIGSATYADLYEAMRVNEFIRASVTIGQQIATQGAALNTLTVKCRIVQVSNMTALSATFHAEQVVDVAQSEAPQRVLERSGYSAAIGNKIPTKSDGEAFPMPFGQFIPYLPDSLYGSLSDGQIQSQVVKAGIRAKGTSALEIQKNSETLDWLFAETTSLSGGLGITSILTQSLDTYVYVPDVDQYARVWELPVNSQENLVYNTARWQTDHGYYLSVNRAPYMQVPILAGRVVADASTSLSNGDRAIDGKAETYSTLAYHGNNDLGGVWEVPSVQSVGRIVQQSTALGGAGNDFEGSGSPVGIQVFALLVLPSGSTVPSGGSVRLALRFPDDSGSDVVFSLVSNTTPSVTSGSVQLVTLPLPVADSSGSFGGYDFGWGGTKWEDWDFSAAGDDSGRDKPLYNRGTVGRDARNVRIMVTNNVTNQADIHIASVGLLVSFRQHWDVRSRNPNDINTDPDFKRTRKILGNRYYELPDDVQKLLPFTPVERAMRRRVPQRSNYLGNVFVSMSGYKDTSGGTYTGTANAVMTNPMSWIWYLLDVYAEQSGFATSGLGSFNRARQDLDLWAKYGNAGTTLAWSSTHTCTEKKPVRDHVDDILAGCPDAQVLRAPQGGNWRAHVWIPNSSSWSTYSTTPVHPVHILDGSEGLALEFGTTDLTDIINDLEIRYDYDPGAGRYNRVATCNPDGSDDGYGNEWPVTPTTAVAAKDLAAWSKARFGKRRYTLDLPGIFDPRMAVGVGLQRLWRLYRPVPVVSFSSTLRLYDMEPWHVFRFDDELEDKFRLSRAFWGTPSSGEGSTWENIWWRVTRSEQTVGSGGVRSMQIEAEWYPTVIGTGVQAGAGTEPMDPGSLGIGEI